jgi:hypothetical protein
MSEPCKQSGCSPVTIESYLDLFNFQGANYAAPVITPAKTCALSDCQTDAIETYIGGFNFQAGVRVVRIVYPNNGHGGGGTGIDIEYPPSPQFISYKGCQSTIIREVPAGATQAQIDAIVDEVLHEAANQQAICDAPPPPPGGDDDTGGGTGGGVQPPDNPDDPGSGGDKTYSNTQQSVVACPSGMVPKALTSLPPATSLAGNTIVVEAGLFWADSIAQANADAVAFLNTLAASGLYYECGWYNEYLDYDCGDGSHVIVPAGTYFSTVSQADANAQAQAYAVSQCVCDNVKGINFGNAPFSPSNGGSWTYVVNVLTGTTVPGWAGSSFEIWGDTQPFAVGKKLKMDVQLQWTGGLTSRFGYEIYQSGSLVANGNVDLDSGNPSSAFSVLCTSTANVKFTIRIIQCQDRSPTAAGMNSTTTLNCMN